MIPIKYTLSYALSGTNADDFDISSSTGQISVGSDTDLDYETKTSYSVIVTMTASEGSGTGIGALDNKLNPNGTGAYLIPVTINVTDVDETPTFPSDTATRSIDENSAAGTNIGTTVTPSGGQATLTYTLDGTDKDKFTIVSTSGQIQVKTGHIPDYESKTSYTVEVDVTDGDNDTGSIVVTITVTDVNEPPAPPTDVSTEASYDPKTTFDVSWTKPTTEKMAGKPVITHWELRYKKNAEQSWSNPKWFGIEQVYKGNAARPRLRHELRYTDALCQPRRSERLVSHRHRQDG